MLPLIDSNDTICITPHKDCLLLLRSYRISQKIFSIPTACRAKLKLVPRNMET